MSKLLVLFGTRNQNLHHLIKNITIRSNLNKNFLITNFKPNNQIRLLASANNQAGSNLAKPNSETTNVLDKPQWERSDRYKIFYGFNSTNEAEDKALAHFFTFVCLFGVLFVPLFILYYYPDYKTNDWCWREAYLELSRREKAGEPLVNPDYIPSERIKLPSDEEIGDMEIII